MTVRYINVHLLLLVLLTGHEVIFSTLADYLHCIERQDSATCPHCNGAKEMADHLVFQCGRHGPTSKHHPTHGACGVSWREMS